MGKRRLKKQFRFTRTIAIAGIAAIAFSVPVLADNETTTANLDVYELSMTDTDPVSSLEARFLEAKSEDGLQLINIDPSETEFDVEGLDIAKTGLQTVHVNMTVVTTDDTNKSVSNDYSEDVLVKMVMSKAPQLILTTGSANVDLGSEFNANNYISYIGDISGNLPVLKIDSNVDTNTEGTYQVTYTVVNKLGISSEQKLNVTVAKSAEQIAAEEAAAAEAAAQAEAEAQARAAAAAMSYSTEDVNAHAVGSGSTDVGYIATGTGGYNPYPGYNWNNCTWGAWQACYNATGISLPGWGNAYEWLYNASAQGWATGSAPAAGSVCVYTHHVAWVAAVSDDGQYVYIVEGNYNGHQMIRWVNAYGSVSGQYIQGYIYVG